ncbi:ABC transporter substrate-binding protein [Aestuariimicrobium soli]|uniref:ABC transporter substrate-binding protein n=1 Tax=Aestuariimicrobium soli TaxID=2035834 RepID=UPI003EBD6C13
MKRRLFLSSLAAAAATTAVTAAGCGSSSTGSSGGTVNLTFRQFDPPTEIAGLQKAVDAWNTANPKIQIKMETLSGADTAQQFAREANSGSGPDIVQLGYVSVKDLAKPKILKPIGDLIDKSALDTPLDKFLALDMNVFDDQTWALPWTVDTFAMTYNPDAMGGAKAPTTWEELQQTAATIGGQGKTGFAFAGASSPVAGQWFALNYYMWSKGFSLIEQDGDAWAPGATADQFKSAMDYFNSFFTSGATPKSMMAVESANDPQIISSIGKGDTAMTMMAPQTLRNARQTSDKVVSAVMPDGLTDGATHLGGRSLGINASSKHPEEAWEFIKFLSSAKAFETIPQFPAATTVLSDMKVNAGEEGYQQQLPHSRSFARYIKGPVPVATLQKLSCAAFGSVYSGQQTSDKAAQALVNDIAQAIKG